MATQNPIENEGVYPLPEAQRDRFLFKVVVDYPSVEEEREIVYRMGVDRSGAASRSSTPHELVRLQKVASTGLRPPRARRLRRPCHRRDAHACDSSVSTTSPVGSPTARRRARRSASSPHRARWRSSADATTSSRRTCSRSFRTCCATVSCCPTTRWPTRCRPERRHHPDPADRRAAAGRRPAGCRLRSGNARAAARIAAQNPHPSGSDHRPESGARSAKQPTPRPTRPGDAGRQPVGWRRHAGRHRSASGTLEDPRLPRPCGRSS